MRNFSFRAECKVDVERFHQECARRGLLVTWAMQSDEIGPDVEVDAQSTASLAELRDVMHSVVDGHVMLQTLRECPLSQNTLERDYNLRHGEQ